MQRIGIRRILGQYRSVDLLRLQFHPTRLVVDGHLHRGEDGDRLVGRSVRQPFDACDPEIAYTHSDRVAAFVEDDAEGVLCAGFEAVDVEHKVGRFVEALGEEGEGRRGRG